MARYTPREGPASTSLTRRLALAFATVTAGGLLQFATTGGTTRMAIDPNGNAGGVFNDTNGAQKVE